MTLKEKIRRKQTVVLDWWISKGIILPIFDIIGGALQHLFDSKMKTVVKVDGFTYVKDIANKGTDRLQETGKSLVLDGVNGIITIGNIGNIQYVSTWVTLPVDNQMLFSLANSASTSVSVVGGVLTFGGSLTVNNIYIDGVSKTASEAGVILNDNANHFLYIDFTQIAASNLVLGTDSSTYGNITLFSFRTGNAVEPIADVIIVYNNPNALFGTEIGIWHLDEGAGLAAYDSSANSNNGTISGGVTQATQDIVSFQNYYGYNKPASVYIPARLSSGSPTVDVLGDSLGFSGKVPKDGRLVESHGGTFDGVADKIMSAHLTGTETVISSGGTSTPTVASGEITFTVGTCWNLLLSDGTHYPMSEGEGLINYDTSGSKNNATISAVEAGFWAATQDLYHYNVLNGFDVNAAFFDGTSYVTIGSPDTLPIGESLKIVCLFTGNIDYLIKLTPAGNDYIRLVSGGQISIRSNNVTIQSADGYSFKNRWVSIEGTRSTSTNYEIRLYNLSGGLLSEDLTNTIATPFGVDRIAYVIGSARPSIIKSVEITNQHKWTYENNWVDEIGSSDGVVTGTIKTPKIPDPLYPETSNTSGKYHNGAETKWLTNPLNDPELIYRSNLDNTDVRHNTDAFVRPEFIDANEIDKTKNYVVYDKNITVDQGNEVDSKLGN